MKGKIYKIFIWLFALLSVYVIVYEGMFILNQLVNIKYCFEHGLPTHHKYATPVYTKEFFYGLVFGATAIIGYAVFGFILSIYFIRKSITKK